ncbi:MAG: UvrD-helicase domain-containing protein, partial [Actinobacteria bacterium]|nr:UvrD-helicase domain-containing protein [Actinomycetota bacterium]
MFDAAGLNCEQRRVVEHDCSPLLVLAGAGTGKTATLAARVGHLLERGVQPERVCLLTFSRRAAGEMLRRAGHLADPALAARVVGGTF